MGEAQPKPWTLDEFLAWEEQQEDRYEFVDGEIVMMTGGTQAHALIAANLISILRPVLRRSPCRPNGSDLKVVIPGTGNSRYPDITIDCGHFNRDAHSASEPKVVFEVLSKSTASLDQEDRLWDYQKVPSIQQYVCTYQDRLRIHVWLRNPEGEMVMRGRIVGPADVLHIVGVSEPLAIADIYEGTGLVEKPSTGLIP